MKQRLFYTILLIFGIQISTFAQSPSFKTYMNPVIPGDHPDCTVSKYGKYFYTTGSSFNVTPTIYHSTDLVHWEAIAQPVSAAWSSYGDKPGGGCWGGHVVYYGNKFWHFFSAAGSMHFTTATTAEGPWSSPTRINNPSQLPYSLGYDNSIFIDDDGKWYLIVKNGQPNNAIVELGTTGQPTGVVYNLKWLNPGPSYTYSWAEGPVMWKYKGFYYYSFARDLAGGQKTFRSKTLTADSASWTLLGDFFNENDPLKSTSLFSAPNHVSNVMLIDDSTSWTIHPIYAKSPWNGQGRQGLLNQVRYDANGKPVADYPTNKYFTAPNLPTSGIPWMVPKSDFFETTTLKPEWCFMGYTPTNKLSLTEKVGWLRLSPKTSKLNSITKNDAEHNYSLITKLDFSPTVKADEAGLLIVRGDESILIKLSSTVNDAGSKVIRFSYDTAKCEVDNSVGNIVWLKLNRNGHIISGYFSADGTTWTKLSKDYDVTTFDSYSDFTSFTGNRQGLYVQNKNAYFDFYIYRDAYSPILAECPANQFGTTRLATSSTSYVLDQIHNNDWALYAGVEFGNEEYTKKPTSIEFVAATTNSVGKVEVWLDSIDTGTKIGECAFTTTGSFSVYKTFKTSNIAGISGRHDVYLRFKGTLTTSLFRLQSFRFTSDTETGINEIQQENSNLNIFPNPSNGEFSIQANFPFKTVAIYSIDGKIIAEENFKQSLNNYTFTKKLEKGIYLIKVENKGKKSMAKLIMK